MIRAFVWLTLGSAALLAVLALWDYGVARWHQFLERRCALVLAAERARHAAELEAQRRSHQESTTWLLQLHRDVDAQRTARHQRELDAIAADVLAQCCAEPKRRAS